jgi:hypothetical protein
MKGRTPQARLNGRDNISCGLRKCIMYYLKLVEYIRRLVNTASVSVGIGKIQLCHYNLVWGKNRYFRWHTIDIYSTSFK